MNILTILFFGFFSLTSFCNGLCIERERQALLKLKQSLVDPAHRLASWSADNGDCCRWKGIVCHNLTSHVLQLHLSAPTYTEDLYDLGDAYQEINVTSQLRGQMSNAIGDMNFVVNLDFSENSDLKGKIPMSMGNLCSLRSISFSGVNLSQEISDVLEVFSGCVSNALQSLDLNGNIPPWIGISLTKLIIMSLRSNKFWGHISKELCALSSLQILDFAHNNLSGSIPRCIGNLSAMVMDYHSSRYNFESYFVVNYVGGINFLLKTFADQRTYFLEDVFVVKKGQVLDYSKTLYLVKVMDFSSNNLSGEIPSEITILNDLQSLNLSHNFFSGRIPGDIGSMRMLESLDLSVNELSGSIPQSMANLTFLGCLNLSNNQLSGRIPSSTQLQSFNASSYGGNKLCGPPLMYNCSEVGSKPDSRNSGGRGEDHGAEINWFFVSMALGFIVVFWSFLSPLVINRRWRYRYYQFLDDMWWKISDFACRCF
ncbi:hypothetical protein SLEP1_g44400 [Rubroshorea leprosula]|uniref:Leucine-rich repeat-containing N-terminal plant-type domain-containing protein n=1 Tax=Rubroshorea leprosula TaxID=152421 RepID=A0AAV5LHY6_9ROSI|nr:hypothetical protein SLEP1_g44400 [Rubroshorea leprosula]